MHVEACLAYAMQDIYSSASIVSVASATSPLAISRSPISQPWFGLWQPPQPPRIPGKPDPKPRKPLLVCGAGSDLATAKQSALSRLLLTSGDVGSPSQVTLWKAQDPHNPLWSTMLGNASTPNQIAQGIALRLSLAMFFDKTDLVSATQSANLFCQHQLTRGMMSVRHGDKIVSEFIPVSHLWIWLLAYSYLCWLATRLGSESLLSVTSQIWLKLAAYMKVAGTPDGHLLCAGPRAWRKPDPRTSLAKFSFQSAAGDSIYCDLHPLLSAVSWPDKRLKGLDMLGARIVRDHRDRFVSKDNDRSIEDIGLPVSVDPITVARNNDRQVIVYLDGLAKNNTPPGPLYWSKWQDGVLSYGVEEENINPDYRLFDKHEIELEALSGFRTWKTQTSIT